MPSIRSRRPANPPSPACWTARCTWPSPRPSQGFTPLEQGKTPPALHFAQVNEKDGFFLTGRSADPAFTWDKLKGTQGAGRSRRASRWPCSSTPASSAGSISRRSPPIDAGSTDKMIAAFRKGEGDFIHLQGPAPQQLEHDGAGHIVTSLADAIGPCAFSSLAATREWLATDMAKRFMAAYRKARAWLIATPAAEVAKAEASFFPDIDLRRAHLHHRHLPEARQLDAARRDHQAGLGGHRRHLPARRPDHQAAPLRGRDRAAASVTIVGRNRRSRIAPSPQYPQIGALRLRLVRPTFAIEEFNE